MGVLEGFQGTLLGGSWVVISGVISPLTLLITRLITTHEPPSKDNPYRSFYRYAEMASSLLQTEGSQLPGFHCSGAGF